jgi:hypothetical protein
VLGTKRVLAAKAISSPAAQTFKVVYVFLPTERAQQHQQARIRKFRHSVRL